MSRFSFRLAAGIMVLFALGFLLIFTSGSPPATAAGPTNVSGSQFGAWTLANSPYIVTGQIVVPSGQTLAIQPGVEVRFDVGAWIDVYGTLNASGASGQPVVFTSNAGTKAKGDWYYIWFAPGSAGTLSQCTMQFGGRGNSAMLRLTSNVSITNCVLSDSAGDGAALEAANLRPTFDTVTSQNNTGAAIRQFDVDANPIYRALTFSGNGTNAVVVNSSTVETFGVLDGAAMGQPFLLGGQIVVAASKTLSVTAGTTVQFATGAWMDVYGTLFSQGSSTQKISYTSAGDTFPSGALSTLAAVKGDWYYLFFFAGSSGTLSQSVFRYGGRGDAGMLRIASSAVSVTNCTFADSASDAIVLVAADVSPTIDTVTIQNNAGAAIRQFDIDATPTYRTLTFTGNGTNAVVVNSSTVETFGVLAGAAMNQPYLLAGQIVVAASKTLSVTPGTTVQFATGAWMDVYGRLSSVGTPTQPITFTSAGDTFPSSALSTLAAAKGDWYYLNFLAGATGTLSYCTLRYGGRGDAGTLRLSANVVVTNCTLSDSASDGIVIVASNISPTIDSVTIRGNAGAAIRQFDIDATPAYRAMTFSGNGANAVVVNSSTVETFGVLDGAAMGQPFLLGGQIVVAASKTLSVTAGTTVQFATGAWMDVYGTLQSAGTIARRIAYTSAGTSGSGGTSAAPAPGDWYYIHFLSGSAGTLEYCDFRFGGRDSNGMLLVDSSTVSVRNCAFTASSSAAIVVANNAQPTIASSQIYSNAFGLRNNTPGSVVDARNNCWGDIGGPFHPTQNSTGKGNAVSDGVNFIPWSTVGCLGVPVSLTFDLRVGGPERVSPGETVNYSVFYANLTDATIKDAVVIVLLPRAAEFVDATGGGIYWEDRNQVFWRLGNPAPGASGIFAFRVRYLWGLPQNFADSALAVLAGSEVGADLVDVEPYLTFSTNPITGETLLTADQIAAERQSNADFNTIYSQALASGFQFGAGHRITYADGSVLIRATLVRPDTSEIMLLGRKDAVVQATIAAPDKVGMRDATGGVTITQNTGAFEFWGAWNDRTTASETGLNSLAAEPTYLDCFQNCMIYKAAGWVAKKLSTVVSTIRSINDCIKWGGGDAASGVKCAMKLTEKIPGLSEVIDVGKCVSDCRTDKTKHVCQGTLIKCGEGFGASSWNPVSFLMKLDSYSIYECIGSTGLWSPVPHGSAACGIGEKCDPTFRNDEGKPCLGCGSSVRSADEKAEMQAAGDGFCFFAAGAGASCSIRTTSVRVARDPNEKIGPAGDLVPGQVVTYTVTYENEGQGTAFGVYIEDRLSDGFDLATLQINGPGVYLPASRSINWDIGELAPKAQPGSSGIVSFTVRLKTGLASGTVITNQAVVYFPSVPETTPTNTVVNVVQPLTAVPQTVRTPATKPISILLQSRTVTGGPLTYQIVSGPLAGELSGAAPNLTYTPPPNFTGGDSFTFLVSDGAKESRPADVLVIVEPSSFDTIAPQVTSTSPVANARDIPVDVTPIYTDSLGAAFGPAVLVHFSEVMSTTTVTAATVRLLDSDGRAVPALVNYFDLSGAILLPRSALKADSTYQIVVSGQVRDASGNPMAADFTASFHTAAAPGGAIYLPVATDNWKP